MDNDAVLRAAAITGLKLTKLVEQAEHDFIHCAEGEGEIRRAFVAAYIVARDTWASFLAALGEELQDA